MTGAGDHQPVWANRKGRSSVVLPASLGSLGAHAALVFALWLQAIIGPCGGRAVEPTINYVSVISLPKGNPNAGGRPLDTTDVAPPPTPPPVDDSSMTVPNETPVSRSSATPAATPDARLAALDAAKQEAARKEALRKLLKDKEQASSNQGSGTGTESGNVGVPNGTWDALPGAITYEALVRATIEANWLPPTWVLENKKILICEVHIWVGFDGRVIKRQLVKKSGNTAYDASALAAIDKTDRLPLPPEETRDFLLKQGITLRFNPTSKMQ